MITCVTQHHGLEGDVVVDVVGVPESHVVRPQEVGVVGQDVLVRHLSPKVVELEVPVLELGLLVLGLHGFLARVVGVLQVPVVPRKMQGLFSVSFPSDTER